MRRLIIALLLLSSIPVSHAAAVSGQGTWQTTLQPRYLNGDSTPDAYYDTALGITWLADANYARTSGYDADGLMTWSTANDWAAGLNPYGSGITGWRLPDTDPVNGTSYNYAVTFNGGSDRGYNPSAPGTAYAGSTGSELAHMSYNTLGNLGYCNPATSTASSCAVQAGYGVTNTGPFANLPIQSVYFWSSTGYARVPPQSGTVAWSFNFRLGDQAYNAIGDTFYAWAVHTGDVGRTTPVPFSLTLKNPSSTGCKTNVGTVTLMSPAPAAGAVVTLSDTLTSVKVPVSLKVLAGETTKTFTVTTTAVAANESGTVSATLDSATVSQPLTVRPMGLSSITLTPTSAVGGNQVTGKATLECKAGPGAILVDLSSSNAAVATPVAASIAVPQGLQSVSFDVSTSAVQAKSYATTSGAANGITKSKKLTVNVAAAVSPTSLKFGSVAVGTTSTTLNTTLTNKGTATFSVSSIGLTGTNAKYYAQTNNCPSNLAAGASCTIGVSFKPTVTGSKSATLSIATSATSTSLKVTLSGTGL